MSPVRAYGACMQISETPSAEEASCWDAFWKFAEEVAFRVHAEKAASLRERGQSPESVPVLLTDFETAV